MFEFQKTYAVLALALLSGCANTSLDRVTNSPQVEGDSNGGKIAHTLETSDKQTAAYQAVTTHCEKFGKKGYITKMNYDTGLVTFDCRLISKTKSAN
ncbi:hypothetical protein [Rhodoplanes sp. Z2-YC6860]|uniref:hypothetical protein n=1 Tax=Rhodoplanes sp. Z2-YC6860 TaxID=674703 RepID=UPI0008363A9D|nr:hypothetical protein [Rhodoplanes sp. Z2-YC6860]